MSIYLEKFIVFKSFVYLTSNHLPAPGLPDNPRKSNVMSIEAIQSNANEPIRKLIGLSSCRSCFSFRLRKTWASSSFACCCFSCWVDSTSVILRARQPRSPFIRPRYKSLTDVAYRRTDKRFEKRRANSNIQIWNNHHEKVAQMLLFFYFEIKKKKEFLFANKFRLFDHEIVIAYRSKYEKKTTRWQNIIATISLTIDRLHSKNVYDKRRHSSGTSSLNFSSLKHSFGVCPNCKITFERKQLSTIFSIYYFTAITR